MGVLKILARLLLLIVAALVAVELGWFLVEQRDVEARTLLFFSEQSGNAVLSRFPIRSVKPIPLPGYTNHRPRR